MKRSTRRRFAYQMAVKLGVVNVERDILRALTAKQMLDWEAYASLEPFDETRADARAALIAGMVFNMAVAVKDRKPASEWMLKFETDKEEEKPKAPQTFEEQIAIAKIWVETMAEKPLTIEG